MRKKYIQPQIITQQLKSDVAFMSASEGIRAMHDAYYEDTWTDTNNGINGGHSNYSYDPWSSSDDSQGVSGGHQDYGAGIW